MSNQILVAETITDMIRLALRFGTWETQLTNDDGEVIKITTSNFGYGNVLIDMKCGRYGYRTSNPNKAAVALHNAMEVA